MNDSVRSAARVLDLLEYFAGAEGSVSLSAATASLGMPKSSTLALLRTLLARGYVLRDDKGSYVLNETFRSHGFGWGGDRFARLIAVARPAMDALCASLGETVILGGLTDDGQVKLLAKSVGTENVRYDADLATTSPAYCTAMGRIMLAHMAPARRHAILCAHERTKLTPHTVVELDRLNTLIDEALAQGYCIIEEEFALGGTGVATCIVGPDGEPLAALDVACVTTRFHDKRARVIAALQAQIANLPTQFYLPPPRPVDPIPEAKTTVKRERSA